MKEGVSINGNEQCYRKLIGILKFRSQLTFQQLWFSIKFAKVRLRKRITMGERGDLGETQDEE